MQGVNKVSSGLRKPPNWTATEKTLKRLAKMTEELKRLGLI